MKYDFESIIDRKGRDALAVDLIGAPGSPYPAPRDGFDPIPMWIAVAVFIVAGAALVIMSVKHFICGEYEGGKKDV